MKIIFAVLFVFSGVASADVIGTAELDVNGWSKHSEDTYSYDGVVRKFNSSNSGLGVTMTATDIAPQNLSFSVGWYENSYYRNTLYASVNVHLQYNIGAVSLQPGVSVGLATGYDDTPVEAGLFQVVAMPVVSISVGNIGARVGYMPASLVTSDGSSMSVATLQISYRVK